MDAKEHFRQSLADEKESLSRQPITDGAMTAAKRERWAQTVTPVIEFVDWLKTQKEGAFGFGSVRVEKEDRWTTDLFVYEGTAATLDVQFTKGVLRIEVTPDNEAPFCWSTMDEGGLWAKDTRCHQDLETFLNEVADYAGRLYARIQHERIGRSRVT